MNQSFPSSIASSQSAESIFDTMYDMSVKEEALRNDLKDVYGQIDYLKKVIEEASIQLNRYTEKKLRVCINVSLSFRKVIQKEARFS